MKKIISMMLVLLLIFGSSISSFAGGAASSGSYGGDASGGLDISDAYYEYDTLDGEATITAYTGSEENIVIPSTLGGYPVVRIGNYAFNRCENRANITSVTIPGSVKTICTGAFEDCYNLTSVAIESGLGEIGDRAFTSCENLKTINIPDGVTSIGYYAFGLCYKLEDVELPNSITNIGRTAFAYCHSLESIVIPGGVSSISEGMFRECPRLENVIISSGVSRIEKEAFDNCGVEVIDIPYSVTFVDDQAFALCFGLETVNYECMMSDWENISIGVDNECLTEAKIVCLDGIINDRPTSGGDTPSVPDGPGYDDDYDDGYDDGYDDEYNYGTYEDFEYEIFNGELTILYYSGQEKNVVIPDTIAGYPVLKISDWAFNNSWTLESVVIPASVTEIGLSAFAWCENLVKIEVAEGNTNYVSVDDVLFTSDMRTLVQYPTKKTTKVYEIPEGVKEIASDAFGNCEYVETIKIPASLVSMEDSTFAWCYNLKSIEVAKGNDRFMVEEGILFSENKTTLIMYPRLKSEKSYDIPDGVKRLASHAFIDSTLEEVTIPASVTKIFGETFAFCHRMKSIEVAKANENYASVDGVLFNKDKTEIIKYPGFKKETSYTVPSTVTQIGENAFYMSRNLTSVTMPEGLKSIGGQAFSYCDALKTVVIPSTVTEIGHYTFSDCMSLTTITIPSGIEEIPHGMFAWCEKLKTVNFEGTKAQWEALTEDIEMSDNDFLMDAKVNFGYKYDNSGNKPSATEKPDIPEEPTREYEIAIEGGADVLAKGKTATFKAYIYYEDDGKDVKTKDAIEWMSADESIATVSKGKVKGVGAGETTITAYNEELGLEISVDISVVAPITSLKFASTSATVYVGNEFDLSEGMKISPEEHTDEIVWESADESTATVDEFGVVTPIRTGKVKITAKAVAGGKKATCTLTVAKAPEGIIIEGANVVAQGKTVTLKAYAYYEEDGKQIKTKDAIIWESDNEDIVTVSKGKAKGVAKGTATITAYIAGTDISETFDIAVVVPIKSLKFASTSATVYVGNEFDLSEGMKISPEEHTDEIVWESADESIATVDEFGVVTPIRTGKVKITAKAIAGGKKATCTLTVAREPEGIIITGANTVAQGKTVTLKAYAYYEEDGKQIKTKDVISWESADEEIATVSKGKIKGVSAGKVNIIAKIDAIGLEEIFEVDVLVPAKKVKFASTKMEASIGDVIDLNEFMTVEPFENTDEFVWTSSKENIATVEEGVVTVNGTGKVKITAKAVTGKKSASVTITVK